jgi:hypothetical protein
MGIYSLCDVMVYTKDKTRNTELQAGLDNFRKHIPQREKTQNNEKNSNWDLIDTLYSKLSVVVRNR